MRSEAKFASLCIAIILALSLLSGCGGGKKEQPSAEKDSVKKPETISLRIGAGHPKVGQTYVQVSNEFFVPEVEKRVAEKTNYRIKWTEAYGGSVAQVAEVLEAAESGLLDVALVPFPFEPAKLFLQNFCFYIPFNTPDPVQSVRIARKVFNEFPVLKDMFEKNYNQKFLSLAAIGSYQLITTFPVEKVSDLKGRKIAAAGPNLTLLSGTGAVPVQSNLNEAYTSFQTGVYEGWIVYPSATYGFKLHEVAKYQTNVDFGSITAGAITVNLDTWKKLPKEVQEILQEVALEYEKKHAEVARDADKQALEKMKAEGLKVKDIPLEEKKIWVSGLPNIPNIKAKEADQKGLPGSKVISAYIKYLEEDGHKFPQKWSIE